MAGFGRSDRIRTCDLLVPNETRYQAALRSVSGAHFTEKVLAHKGLAESFCADLMPGQRLKQLRRIEIGQARITRRAVHRGGIQAAQQSLRTSLAGLPGGFEDVRNSLGPDAEQRLPETIAAHRHGLRAGLFLQLFKQCLIDKRGIAGQNQQLLVSGDRKAGANAGQRPGEILIAIADQLVGEDGIAFLIAVAGNDQVIGQSAHGLLQPTDQRLAVPVEQPFVLAADALATAAGQKQDRTGTCWAIRHQRLCQGLCEAVI